MKKTDLESGMLVLLRDNDVGVVIGETMLFEGDGYELLSDYDNDLIHQSDCDCDIIAVSKVLCGEDITSDNWTYAQIHDKPLWIRDDVKEAIIDGVVFKKEPKKGFLNETELEFNDISSETEREYCFPNGMRLFIDKPLYLNVSKSGGHRIYTAEGWSFYVQPNQGWWIKWKVKGGNPNFVK